MGMKKIKSIFIIFGFFLIMIIASFLILYRYSAISLRESLMRVAQIQMEYARALLEQKINEIEIEADGILNSNDLKELQLMVMEEYDPYEYVMGVKNIKEYLNRRQRSNVGMSEFILYWPEQNLSLIHILKAMNFMDLEGQGYTPTYVRNKITDALHESCGFETDFQFISKSKMKEIEKKSKQR